MWVYFDYSSCAYIFKIRELIGIQLLSNSEKFSLQLAECIMYSEMESRDIIKDNIGTLIKYNAM